MGRKSIKGLDDRAVKLLVESKLPYEIKSGSKHDKLYIAGELTLTFARTPTGNTRMILNGITNIKHKIAKIKGNLNKEVQ